MYNGFEVIKLDKTTIGMIIAIVIIMFGVVSCFLILMLIANAFINKKIKKKITIITQILGLITLTSLIITNSLQKNIALYITITIIEILGVIALANLDRILKKICNRKTSE